MQWFTHKAAALAGALAVGAPVAGLVGALLGSVLPDMADTALSGGNKARWRRLHRQTTHWYGWYLLIAAAGLMLSFLDAGSGFAAELMRSAKSMAGTLGLKGLAGQLGGPQGLVGDLVLWLGLGGLSHIVLDSLTPMGVPVAPFDGKRRMGIRRISTGSFGERLFLLCTLGLAAAQFAEVRRLFSLALRQF